MFMSVTIYSAYNLSKKNIQQQKTNSKVKSHLIILIYNL